MRSATRLLLGVLAIGISAGGQISTLPGQESLVLASELARARQLLSNGALDEAVIGLQQLVRQHSTSADAYVLLGTALALVPRQEQALAALGKAIEIDPSSAPAYNALGMAQARFGQPEPARRSFTRALELDPRYAEAHANLGLVLAQLTQFPAAREHLSLAVQLSQEGSSADYWHYLIGKTYSEEGRPREAAQHYEQAINSRPGYVEAYLALGLARGKLFEQQASLAALEKAVALAPRHAEARYELAKQYLKSGKPEQAIDHLREAGRLRPGDRSILFALVRALNQAGQPAEAKAVAEQLKQIIEQVDGAQQHFLKATELNNQAVRLEEQGRLLSALDKYQSALEINPLHAGFRRNLGLLLCRLGRWDEGIGELREAARLDPEDLETTRALYAALDQAAAAKSHEKSRK